MSTEEKIKWMEAIAKSNMSVKTLIIEHSGNSYHYENRNKGEKMKVSDEQISQAIISISGDKKPLNEKQLFLGVICVLLSKYGWSGRWTECCARINNLPMRSLFEKECDYNSIKILTAFRFASVDYKDWDSYEPSRSEAGIFKKCKAVADAFDEAICLSEE